MGLHTWSIWRFQLRGSGSTCAHGVGTCSPQPNVLAENTCCYSRKEKLKKSYVKPRTAECTKPRGDVGTVTLEWRPRDNWISETISFCSGRREFVDCCILLMSTTHRGTSGAHWWGPSTYFLAFLPKPKEQKSDGTKSSPAREMAEESWRRRAGKRRGRQHRSSTPVESLASSIGLLWFK